MRKPFLSRLMLGGALVATIAFGAVAMQAAIPGPETRDVFVARPDQASDADPALKVERSDSAPVVPVSGAWTSPLAPAVSAPEAEDTPASNTGGAWTDCTGEAHPAASCPNAGDAGGVSTSRPKVAVDGDRAPAPTSKTRASRAERRVSSGPMRMLGGGESTW